MKYSIAMLLSFTLAFVNCTFSEKEDKATILQLLKKQEKAWSNHDLVGFMETYWESDSLKFYGANGLTFGWKNTLEGYKKRYPTKNETGTLNFIIDDISRISDDAYHVMGQYHLKRDVGDANGVFLIIFRRINGEWKIVADMSC